MYIKTAMLSKMIMKPPWKSSKPQFLFLYNIYYISVYKLWYKAY